MAIPFPRCFSELLGLLRELRYPKHDRRCVWFSGDAATTRIGGISWDTRTYFALGPLPVLREFMPAGLDTPHIDENEFLTEILRTVLRGEAEASLLLLGVTDNTTSNMWFAKGRSRRGVGLRLTRAFHRWTMARPFRYGSFYCRSERNVDADFVSRASDEELLTWETTQAITRVDPTAAWSQFRQASLIHSHVSSSPALEPQVTAPIPANQNGLIVEWKPSGSTLCHCASERGFRTAWISPRCSPIARIPHGVGLFEHVSGPVTMLGGLSKDLYEVRQFWEVLNSLQRPLGFLLTRNSSTSRKWSALNSLRPEFLTLNNTVTC